MKQICLLLLSFWSLNTTLAQDITEEQQTTALEYIGAAQQLITGLNQVMTTHNQVHFDQSKTVEQRKAAQDKNAPLVAQFITAFEEYPPLEYDFDLHSNILDYAGFMKKMLLKDKNYYYHKKAAEKTGCGEQCLATVKLAYKLQQKDYKAGDVLYEKTNSSMAKVAEVYLIELQDDTEELARIDKMYEAVDFIFVLNLGVLAGVTVFNDMAKSLDGFIRSKGESGDLAAMHKGFSKDIKEADNYLYKLEETEREFYGDKSLWEAADLFFEKLKDLDKNGFPQLIELDRQKRAGEQPSAEMVNDLAKKFNMVATYIKKYESARVKLMNKYF